MAAAEGNPDPAANENPAHQSGWDCVAENFLERRDNGNLSNLLLVRYRDQFRLVPQLQKMKSKSIFGQR
jgi:hypothetical protein